ncbi:hypothetical protein KC614_02485 [candidate division WWE3 bacterium]|uniref:TVP38/TMEM64 family membrane protein n=1 Tax=candidate division WWE3 bacterium TaxID=2053526 RepID=A0A955RR22_UNCKA|nr:hypothetical protein [candidate division WWE3 bacterium]
MKYVKPVLSKGLLVVVFIVPLIAIRLASGTDFVINLSATIQQHRLIYLVALFCTKTISIIYPPLPGIVATVASIPFVGWEAAYVTDILGSLTGASITFYLGKRYGLSILNHVLGEKITSKVKTIQLKDQNQIEAAIFLRFAAGGLLSDALSWGASLIGFSYISLIAGYIIFHLITILPVFIILSTSISVQTGIIGAVMFFVAWLVIIKFNGRYFE